MTKKCGVWSAERGERPVEGDEVWRLGSGVGAVVAAGANRFLDRINRRDRIIPGQALSTKRFQTSGSKFQSIPIDSNAFQPIPTLF